MAHKTRRAQSLAATSRLIGWLVPVCLVVIQAAAAELQEQTKLAFARYTKEATRSFLERIRGSLASSAEQSPSTGLLAPPDGEVIVGPGGEDGIIGVAGGLIHHWKGTTFMYGVTLERALAVSYAYDDYHAFYKPVVASQLLARDGNSFRARLRLKESAGGMTAVLDVTTHVEYFYPEGGGAYSISRSEEIREVENTGTATERQLPAGRDSGYLWSAVTLNRFVERES